MTAVPASAASAASASWAIVTTPDVGSAQGNAMDGVSCAKAESTFCMAVGGYYTGTNPAIKHTEVQQWNGMTWKIVKSPNVSGPDVVSNFLDGVSCPTTKFCMAAGDYWNTSDVQQNLIEKWTGTKWLIVKSPDTSTALENGLFAGGQLCQHRLLHGRHVRRQHVRVQPNADPGMGWDLLKDCAVEEHQRFAEQPGASRKLSHHILLPRGRPVSGGDQRHACQAEPR